LRTSCCRAEAAPSTQSLARMSHPLARDKAITPADHQQFLSQYPFLAAMSERAPGEHAGWTVSHTLNPRSRRNASPTLTFAVTLAVLEGRELARWLLLAVGPGAAFLPPVSRSAVPPQCPGQVPRSVSSSRPSNRACGSPAHGSPTSFTAGIRHYPPGPEGPGCDDGSVQGDQAELIR
jgi:hypothetical protein